MKDRKGRVTLTAREMRAESSREHVGTVVELFAGVGGFRLGLEGVPLAFHSDLHRAAGYSPEAAKPWRVVWANQWEPSTKAQHAFDCYASRFAEGEHVNQSIAEVPTSEIPTHDLLVGGFPCQDYSIAKPLNQAHGIQGRKGVLWWEIHRILEAKRPRFVVLENVDRLLKSPGRQRGRDFAIILATMSDLGYLVEWRVVNAGDYGFPQRRRRVFIVGRRVNKSFGGKRFDGFDWIVREGVLARALPWSSPNGVPTHPRDFPIEGEPHEVSAAFGTPEQPCEFLNAGVMLRRDVWTRPVVPAFSAELRGLGDVLLPDPDVPESFFIAEPRLGSERNPDPGTWRYLKGSKREERSHKGSGAPYLYTEGALPFPDPLTRPSRTVLTGEGGSGPSRFKHVVQTADGRYRRLTPVELERLNGFPDGWTEGMSDVRRAFCMGNALVVGVVRRIGDVLAQDLAAVPVAAARS